MLILQAVYLIGDLEAFESAQKELLAEIWLFTFCHEAFIRS
jgi:hypothetical protein